MKILVYNWAQFDNSALAGGGVSLYLRNVIGELLRRDDVEVYFLSSGHQYGLFRRGPRIKPTPNAFDNPRLKTFTLVNSPIKAPAHDAFYSVEAWLRDTVTTRLIKDFLNDHGPFDAFHIHNLEGISSNVLSLPKNENLKKLFYTFHNYMPVCPQIELLYDNREPCTDYRDGARCRGCLAIRNDMKNLIFYQRVAGSLQGRGLAGHPLGNFAFDILSGSYSLYKGFRNLSRDLPHGIRNRFDNWSLRPKQDMGTHHDWKAKGKGKSLSLVSPAAASPAPAAYRQWREGNGHILHENVDGLFAVSDLCRDTVQRFLPEGTQVETLPLPIDVDPSPEHLRKLRDRRGERKRITLSFVGYPIPSKGLPFLIDALTGVDDPFYRENVDLLLVSRLGERQQRQIAQLETRFHSVRIIPGYARHQLAELSQMIDLNIVPSTWWETFNQVTAELARLGVPSLVSDRVGAKQIIPNPDNFVFRAGDAADLRDKLDRLLKNEATRASFFDQALRMPSVREHVDLLLERYRS